jgi:predicted GNAT family N-acyltransferase
MLPAGWASGEGGVHVRMTVSEGGREEPYLEIREVTSQRDLREVIAIRRTVFTEEQHLTDVVDRDPYDHGPGSVQVLARLDGEPVGVGRLHVSRREGQIAWVAVLRPYRGKGVGWEIMDALLSAAGRLGASRVTLSAQTHATDFYRLLGFRTVGTTWIMGNIEHITMLRELDEN